MCGIAGYIGPFARSGDQVKDCLSLMKRRGPDASASYMHGHSNGRSAALLHSRLSIIDLDPRSNQPFRIGSKVLVFNGEVYNYIELKRELAGKGHSFVTESDTEVLLKIVIEYGWKGLEKCEGMWAFAIYDEADGSLVLSRDRFGEKPLYLFKDEGGLSFGSEVKFVQALSGRRLKINHSHLWRYMVNGYKSLYKVNETFFQGVKELPIASALVISGSGQETLHRYWNPVCEPEDTLSRDAVIEGSRAALIEAVRIRLRADVPLAFCMSGGVDSNSLISIAKRVLNYDVHGFTIVNTDSRYEENDLIELAKNDLQIRHTAIPVNPKNFLPNLRTLVKQHDAPVYTITYYAHWLLMESIAKHGYKISISGTAADELFSGYYDHHLAYLYEIRNDSKLFAESVKNWNQQIKPIVRNPYLGNPELFIQDPSFRGHIFLNAEEFAQFFKNYSAEPFFEESYTKHLLRNRMMNEMFHESVPVILHEDDLNAMYYSIENRSPFLDKRLFEFCNRIPTRYLVKDGEAKAMLRSAMRGIVPDPILDSRRKVGFNAPIFSFLDVKDAKVRASLLDDSPIFEFVKRDKIEGLISKSDLPNSESKFLFYFLNSKIFMEEFS